MTTAIGTPAPEADWFDPGHLADPGDPSAEYDRLRAHGPVARVAKGLYAVTSYAGAVAVLRDAARFRSGPIGAAYQYALPEGAARDEFAHRINFLDPPDHPRVRGVVSRLFTPKQVRALRPWVEALADRLLDAVDASAGFDVLADYAHRVPTATISELLGMPDAERDQLTAWTEATTPLLGLDVPKEAKAGALEAAEAFHAYVGDLFDERRRTPGDDLISWIVQADGLTEPERRSLVVTLYSAGHRTTRDLFTNGLATLLSRPGGYEAVAAAPDRVPVVVAEMLRHATPTTFVARVTAEQADVDGVTVPAGSGVVVLLAAANRDPGVFDEPHAFRPDRSGEADPLSFTVGPHHCLGASLARMEAEVMLDRLVRRCPSLRLAGEPPTWHQIGPFRGVDALPVAT